MRMCPCDKGKPSNTDGFNSQDGKIESIDEGEVNEEAVNE